MKAPKNGAYFTKEELLDTVKDAPTPDETRICVELLYDPIATAPVSALVLLFANRLKMIDPVTAPCEQIHELAEDVDLLINVAKQITMEHVVKKHAPAMIGDLLKEIFGSDFGGDDEPGGRRRRRH